jgi:hypothetical protein
MGAMQQPERPFLTMFTRHMLSRPAMFLECQRTLHMQTCRDFEHVIVRDTNPQGSGFAWAQAQFEAHQDEVRGEYVWQYDDDNRLATPTAIEILKFAVHDSGADIVVFRADHAELGILPDELAWSKGAVYSHMGGEDFIVKRDLWGRHLDAWRSGVYESDWHFMEAIWSDQPRVYWLDLLLLKVQRVSRGMGE